MYKNKAWDFLPHNKNQYHSPTLLFNDHQELILVLYLEHDINGTFTTKLYDKRNDFNFAIVNYPVISCIWYLHVAVDSIFDSL